MGLDGANTPPSADLSAHLQARGQRVRPLNLKGRITRITGCVLHARLPDGRIGEECILRDPISKHEIRAEIIGFANDEAILAPGGDLR